MPLGHYPSFERGEEILLVWHHQFRFNAARALSLIRTCGARQLDWIGRVFVSMPLGHYPSFERLLSGCGSGSFTAPFQCRSGIIPHSKWPRHRGGCEPDYWVSMPLGHYPSFELFQQGEADMEG